MATGPDARLALNEVRDLVALACIDDRAQELLGAPALLRRQRGERLADAARLQIDQAERQRAAGLGRVEQTLAAVERARSSAR